MWMLQKSTIENLLFHTIVCILVTRKFGFSNSIWHCSSDECTVRVNFELFPAKCICSHESFYSKRFQFPTIAFVARKKLKKKQLIGFAETPCFLFVCILWPRCCTFILYKIIFIELRFETFEIWLVLVCFLF